MALLDSGLTALAHLGKVVGSELAHHGFLGPVVRRYLRELMLYSVSPIVVLMGILMGMQHK